MNCPLCNKQAKLEEDQPYFEKYSCICDDSNPPKQWITFRTDEKNQIYGIYIYLGSLILTTFVDTRIYSLNDQNKFKKPLYASNGNMQPLDALNLLQRFTKTLAIFS